MKYRDKKTGEIIEAVKYEGKSYEEGKEIRRICGQWTAIQPVELTKDRKPSPEAPLIMKSGQSCRLLPYGGYVGTINHSPVIVDTEEAFLQQYEPISD